MMNRECISQLKKGGKGGLHHSWFRTDGKRERKVGKWYIPEQKIYEELQLLNLCFKMGD